MEKIDYEGFYHSYIEDLKKQHTLNQKRIRIGMRMIIIIPLIFLITSFLIHSSKLVFLILWIVSLFGIAFYLIGIEYMDFKMHEKLASMGEREVNPLIGEKIEEVTGRVDERANAIDSHVEKRKEEISDTVKNLLKKKDVVIDKIKKRGGNDE